jgi:hypothetical protein
LGVCSIITRLIRLEGLIFSPHQPLTHVASLPNICSILDLILIFLSRLVFDLCSVLVSADWIDDNDSSPGNSSSPGACNSLFFFFFFFFFFTIFLAAHFAAHCPFFSSFATSISSSPSSSSSSHSLSRIRHLGSPRPQNCHFSNHHITRSKKSDQKENKSLIQFLDIFYSSALLIV